MGRKRGRPREVSGERKGFARTFYLARIRRDLTQAEAATELGASLSTIARWETAVMEPRGTTRKFVERWMKGEI